MSLGKCILSSQWELYLKFGSHTERQRMNPLSEQTVTQRKIKRRLIHIHSGSCFQSDLKFPIMGLILLLQETDANSGPITEKLEAKTFQIASWDCAWLHVRTTKSRRNGIETTLALMEEISSSSHQHFSPLGSI